MTEEFCKEMGEKHLEYEQMLGTASKFAPQLIEGPVMVTKNPCSHPGDIRLLKAIGKEDARYQHFRDFYNVIVFPSKGYRPEQNKMSGGDLDGDCFMVMWDKDIL
jgi:RNA-dependent RNA polymerase